MCFDNIVEFGSHQFLKTSFGTMVHGGTWFFDLTFEWHHCSSSEAIKFFDLNPEKKNLSTVLVPI